MAPRSASAIRTDEAHGGFSGVRPAVGEPQEKRLVADTAFGRRFGLGEGMQALTPATRHKADPVAVSLW